jgi:hypothetical protein
MLEQKKGRKEVSDLSPEELTALLQIVAGDGTYTVTWDKPQGIAIFEAIKDWFLAQTPTLYNVIDGAAPGTLSDESKVRFVKAYMQLKALGVPQRRLPTGYYDDAYDVQRELEKETDRGVAIVGAAFVEDKIKIALQLCVVPSLTSKQRHSLFGGFEVYPIVKTI